LTCSVAVGGDYTVDVGGYPFFVQPESEL